MSNHIDNQYIATPAQIANVILTLCAEKNDDYKMTPLKLIKLVYITYAWYFALFNSKLFAENIVAGKRGPVVSSLDGEFSVYEGDIIPNGTIASTYDIELNEDTGNLDPDNDKNNKIIKVASFVVGTYKELTGQEISDITHKKDSCWSKTVGGDPDNPQYIGKVIEDEAIKIDAEKDIKSLIEKKKKNNP